MADIELAGVGVEFVLYQGKSRSLKQVALHGTVGGLIGKSADFARTTVTALRDINLAASDGDRVALIGHNGAGKTTLLRVLAGIYHPTQGSLRCRGRRVPLFELGLGFDDEATGHENIMLRGLVLGLTRREIAVRTEWIEEFSGLADFLNLPVRTYSTGMQLRLMFSIATAVDADIILMDEWIATGDQDFLVKANERLREMVDHSRIMVLATHNLPLVRSLCNRAVLLEGGRIVDQGPVETVLARYAPEAAPVE